MSIVQGSISTHFRVKTEQITEEQLNWPRGSYCIGQKGMTCPDGFHEGSIKWDDKDVNNKNRHEGVLPDGEYDSNTVMNFCCRSDNGSPTNPIQLPTAEPFVLY